MVIEGNLSWFLICAIDTIPGRSWPLPFDLYRCSSSSTHVDWRRRDSVLRPSITVRSSHAPCWACLSTTQLCSSVSLCRYTDYHVSEPVFEFTFLPNPPPRVWLQMSLRLRFFDPQLKERPEQELFIEPDWLLHLRQLDGQIKVCVCFLFFSVGHRASDACYSRASLCSCVVPVNQSFTFWIHGMMLNKAD